MFSLRIELLSATPTNKTGQLKSVMNAHILYRSCIDEESIEVAGIEPVLSLINEEFGGWPILEDSSWNSSMFDFANLLLKLRQYNFDIIFRIGTDIDEQNSSTTTIIVSQINI